MTRASDVRASSSATSGNEAVASRIDRVGGAFLDTVLRNNEYTNALATVPPPEGGCVSGDQLAAYGDEVIRDIQKWWDSIDDRSCSRKVPTFIGPLSIHLLFERSTWHSAQHARQLASVVERFGIQPDQFQLLAAIRRVFASAFTDRAVRHRRQAGQPVVPGLAVQVRRKQVTQVFEAKRARLVQ